MSSDTGSGAGSGLGGAAGLLEPDASGVDQGRLAGMVWTLYNDVDAITALRFEVFTSPEPAEAPPEELVTLLRDLGAAWPDIATTRDAVITEIGTLTNEQLAEVGLSGTQLTMKLSAWRQARALMLAEFDDGQPIDGATGGVLAGQESPAWVQVEERALTTQRPNRFKRACRAVSAALGMGDTVLGSLLRITGLSEKFKEGKEVVERLAGEVAEGE